MEFFYCMFFIIKDAVNFLQSQNCAAHNELIERCIYFYNHEHTQLKAERRRWCDASPLKIQSFLPGALFVLST